MRGLRIWIWRAVGIVLCATSWLIAMGLFSLGEDWFVGEFGIHSFDDLLIHGIVRALGPIGGAIFFLTGGVVLLWLFWRRDPA